jgi:hypothetical protein
MAFGPPLVTTPEQLDQMLAILDRSLTETLEDDQVTR